MSRSKVQILVLLMFAMLGDMSSIAAQEPGDSVKQTVSQPTHAWISLGLGGGGASFGPGSSGGPIAARAAVSLAVNPVVMFTLAATGAGGIDRTLDSINLLAGFKAPIEDGFLFFTAGSASAKCGRDCSSQAGLAFDAGYHFGKSQAGFGVAAFLVRAHRLNGGGVVATADFGSFGR